MKPNLLERAIAFVSPATAARRAYARQVVELAYSAARPGRRTEGWLTPATSGNAELMPQMARLRWKARELTRNNHLAKHAKRTWPNRIWGTGMTPRFASGNEALDAQLLDWWREWCRTCWSNGPGQDGGTFGAMMWSAVQSQWESGDCFFRRRWRRSTDQSALNMQVQLLEADYCDETRDGDRTGDGSYILGGVEFDRLDRRRAYWMFRQHPGDAVRVPGSGLESQRVDAAEVIHFYEPERPGMVRGTPATHAAALRISDLDDYEDAELMRKKVAACAAAFVTQPEGDALPIGKASTRDDGVRLERMEPAMITYLRPGEQVTFADPKEAAGFETAKCGYERGIAASLDMPYEVLTGDLSKVNYSSYRGGLIQYRDHITTWRWNWLVPVLDALAGWFFEGCYYAGRLPADAAIPIVWSEPGFDLLDRESEAKADQIELQLGTATWPQAVARRGYDADEQIAELEEWKDRLKKAGVTFGPAASAAPQDNGKQNQGPRAAA